jgi:hypothetical protein
MLVNKNKCFARKNQKNDYNEQCKNNKKYGNFCGVHKNYLEKNCITINSKDNKEFNSDKIIVLDVSEKKSKGSKTAKNGFKIEKEFINNEEIKKKLEMIFKLRIKNILEAPHGKKYDAIIIFIDNTKKNIQIKKYNNLNGRGNSFDRRDINNLFNDKKINNLVNKLIIICDIHDNEKEDLNQLCNNNKIIIIDYLEKILIGKNENKNDYWCIIKTSDKNNEIQKIENLHILSSKDLFNYIKNSINCIAKKTCLHLTNNIYLQKKGNKKNEGKRENDIQAKFKITQEILNLCDKITLNI